MCSELAVNKYPMDGMDLLGVKLVVELAVELAVELYQIPGIVVLGVSGEVRWWS